VCAIPVPFKPMHACLDSSCRSSSKKEKKNTSRCSQTNIMTHMRLHPAFLPPKGFYSLQKLHCIKTCKNTSMQQNLDPYAVHDYWSWLLQALDSGLLNIVKPHYITRFITVVKNLNKATVAAQYGSIMPRSNNPHQIPCENIYEILAQSPS
jgi:hypothetical protein